MIIDYDYNCKKIKDCYNEGTCFSTSLSDRQYLIDLHIFPAMEKGLDWSTRCWRMEEVAGYISGL